MLIDKKILILDFKHIVLQLIFLLDDLFFDTNLIHIEEMEETKTKIKGKTDELQREGEILFLSKSISIFILVVTKLHTP